MASTAKEGSQEERKNGKETDTKAKEERSYARVAGRTVYDCLSPRSGSRIRVVQGQHSHPVQQRQQSIDKIVYNEMTRTNQKKMIPFHPDFPIAALVCPIHPQTGMMLCPHSSNYYQPT